jgi:hypothetical protein
MATKTLSKPIAKTTTAEKAPAVKKPVVKVQSVTQSPLVKATQPKVAVTKPVIKMLNPVKVKKPKLVRDSFTMPKDEYEVIDSLKLRAGKLGQSVKKSELLRAGIKALASLSDIGFKAALSNVPTLKTGRPKHVK